MPRKPTKALSNPFCQARLEVAKGNKKFFDKEYVSEILNISQSTLSDYELGNTKCIPPDRILRMADAYNAPHLVNMYCREMCPLGQELPKLEIEDLDRTSLRLLSAIQNIQRDRERFLDIVEDGKVDEEEQADFQQIMADLAKIVAISQNLQVWVKKNL